MSDGRACAYCGKALSAQKLIAGSKYCGRQCMASAYRTSVERTCDLCGAVFYAKPAVVARGSARFCSYECMGKSYRNTTTAQCDHCGGAIKIRASHVRRGRCMYCSNECKYSDWREHPERNPNWKGGATAERHNPRLAWEYRRWRTAVLERDNHICQECGATSQLHSHHVMSWAEWPSLRFDVPNGRTLCRSCHHAAHRSESEVAA